MNDFFYFIIMFHYWLSFQIEFLSSFINSVTWITWQFSLSRSTSCSTICSTVLSYTNQFLLENIFMMIIIYEYPLRQIKQDWTKETPLLIFVLLYISLLKVSFKWIKSLQYCELWSIGGWGIFSHDLSLRNSKQENYTL